MCEPVGFANPQTFPQKRVELEDLLAFYPDVDDQNIQELITKKKEFADLASVPKETLQGKYYPHQLLVQRFLESYEDLFLFHDTGTGKSRILDLIGEHFRRNREKTGSIRKVLVLVRSDILKSEIEKQIVASCEDNTYDVGELCPKSRKKAIRRKIKEWYTIVSYQRLSKKLVMMDDSDIVSEFSGYLIFFDEVHNIRFEDERQSRSAISTSETLKSQKKQSGYCKRDTYKQIYRLFHLPYNIKRVIATATPIVNDVREIGDIMNLILPESKKFPEDFPYETASYEDYEPYFRGRISYVRGLDTGINIRHIGIPVNEIPHYEYASKFTNPQIKVFPNYMSEFQNEAYLRAFSQNSHCCKTTFYHAERQSSNFVYPDGTWGTKGFNKYTNKVGNLYYPNREFSEILNDLDKIRECSVKVANIIEITEHTEGGSVYVFDNFVKASGAITIAMCFQGQGYELFNETSSVFIEDFSRKKKYLKPGFKPKKRIALLTGTTPENVFNSAIELMNSPENVHGEYIKVFIASPTGSEGINLNNIISIHIVSGDWKYSALLQAQNRAIRSKSHELLVKECGENQLNVDIYYHVAITRGQPAKSIDAYLYTLAESKDRVNRRVQRFMKRVAIDSYIHQARNVRKSDKPGSMANDYFETSHDVGALSTSRELDCSTYDVYYLKEAVNAILNIIIEHFKNHFSITVDEILQMIITHNHSGQFTSQIRPHFKIPPQKFYIYCALNELLIHNQSLRNRFGKLSYIRKKGDVVFLITEEDLDPPTSGERRQYYYSSRTTAYKMMSLKDITQQISNTSAECEMDALLKSIIEDCVPSPPKIDLCAHLFEREIGLNPDLVKNTNHPLTKYFGENSDHGKRKPSSFFVFYEPTTEIKNMKTRLQQKEKGRGRKPKCGRRLAKLTHYDPKNTYKWDQDTDQIIVHNLYTLKKSNTRYADKARYFKAKGRLRLFKLNKSSGVGIWRDASDVEAVIYSWLIQKEIQRFRNFFESRSLVYGYYLNDKSLIVRNKIREDPSALEDKRKMKVGRVCNNIPPFSLIEILQYLEIEPPALTIFEFKCREDMLTYTLRSKILRDSKEELQAFNDETLMYFARWSRSSKSSMCKRLAIELENLDLLFRAT